MTTQYLQDLHDAVYNRANMLSKENPFQIELRERLSNPFLTLEGQTLKITIEKDGFWGLCRVYNTSRLGALRSELRLLADHCDAIRMDRRRPPSVVLFAVLVDDAQQGSRTGDRAKRFADLVNEIRMEERLLQMITLSRLWWTPNTLTELKNWGADTPHPDEYEVERFFAPLLLSVRDMKRHRPSLQAELDLSAATLPEEVTQVDDSPQRQAIRERVLSLIRPLLAEEFRRTSLAEAPTEPMRLVSAQVEGYRRFLGPNQFHFGAWSILYGPNGTGKSSLLETVPLALSGRLHRGGSGLFEPHVLHHPGKRERLGTLGAVEVQTASGKRWLDLPRPDGETPVPTSTFYLSQESLRSFLTMDPSARFEWICDIMGLTLTPSPTAKPLDELYVAAQALWRRFPGRRPHVASKEEEPAFAETLSHLFTGNEDWHRLIRESERLLKRVDQVMATGFIAQPLSNLREHVQLIKDQAVTGLSAVKNFARAFGAGKDLSAYVRVIQDAAQLIALARQEAASFPLNRVLAIKHLPSAVREERKKNPLFKRGQQRQNDWERRAHLEQQRMIAEILSRISGDASTLVAKAESLSSELKATDKLFRLGKELPPYLRTDLSKLEDHLAPLQGMQESFAQHQAWLQRRVEELDRELSLLPQQEVAEDLPRRRYQKMIDAFQSAMGQAVPDEKGPLIKMAEELKAFLDHPLPDLPGDLEKLVADYYAMPEDATKLHAWGGYAKLYALREVDLMRQQIRRQLEDWVTLFIKSRFARPLGEIMWTLTGMNWNHTRLSVDVDKRGVRLTAELRYEGTDPARPQATRHDASDILNTAEQNLLALAFFFTGYLYKGYRYSKAILMDDPFQSLDDINLLSCVRFFDDVIKAIGAEQVVMALHQEALAEFIHAEYSDRGQKAEGHEIATGSGIIRISAADDGISHVQSEYYRQAESAGLEFDPPGSAFAAGDKELGKTGD